MSAPSSVDAGRSWEREGYRSGAALDGVSSAVVVATDPVHAAWAALGIGRAQSARRRVAIADLVGDVPPLQALVTGEDPHGIAESFLYGISLNKIAQPVGDTGNLFVLPSGLEPVVEASIYRSDRWRRLAAGFREVGALLLVVARADGPGMDELATMFDGMVLVGEIDEHVSPSSPVLTVVSGPRETVRRDEPPTLDPRRAPRITVQRPRPWLVPALAGTLLLSGVVVTAELRKWGARSFDASTPAPPAPAPDTNVASDSATPVDTLPLLTVQNPGDSASSVGYAVEIKKDNSVDDASLDIQQLAPQFPAATYSPIVYGGVGRWYRVLVGAYAEHAQAESLAARVRKSRPAEVGAPVVVNTPLALLVRDSVALNDIPTLTRDYARLGLPVYALLQRDGTARLYAGAFETPDQAGLLAQTLRQAGIEPTLVYRTGSVQ